MNIKRTNFGRVSSVSGAAAKAVESWASFLAENRLLILFSFVFLAGAALAVLIYALSGPVFAAELSAILKIKPVTGGFKGGISALFSSCFSSIVLLAVLFICGLSACGAPVAAVVPLFFGMGLGLTEAYYCSSGVKGFFVAALLVVPHYLIAATALLFGTMESIRLSVLLSRQLLPGGVMGGLWQDFKLYFLRFFAYAVVAFASGVVDVITRLLLGSILLKQ